MFIQHGKLTVWTESRWRQILESHIPVPYTLVMTILQLLTDEGDILAAVVRLETHAAKGRHCWHLQHITFYHCQRAQSLRDMILPTTNLSSPPSLQTLRASSFRFMHQAAIAQCIKQSVARPAQCQSRHLPGRTLDHLRLRDVLIPG